MYCHACGKQMPEGSRFCPACGVETAPVLQQQNITQQSAGAQSSKPDSMQIPAPIVQPQKRKGIFLAGGAVVLVAIIIAAVMIISKATKYQNAISLMESGKLDQAITEFTQLKEYRDSEDQIFECQNRIAYNQAAALKTQKKYEEAYELFNSLLNYTDAADQAQDCQNFMDYNKAVALIESGDALQARDLFLRLGTFQDAAELAAQCKQKIDYDAARALLDAGQYQQALAAFQALGGYEDSSDLIIQCQHGLDYAAADTAYSQGKYYTAYTLYSAMPEYSDSSDRAQNCIQTAPKNGQTYRNDAYKSKSCPITVKTPDDGLNSYLKFYSENGDLVCCMFIASGKSARVSLPAGNYQIKEATGTNWFGEEEMFGLEGASYYALTFGDGATTTTLERNYIYTLTLRNASDGNVGMNTVDPSGF